MRTGLTEMKNITQSVNKEKIAKPKPKQNFRYPWKNGKCVLLSRDVSEGEKEGRCAGEQFGEGAAETPHVLRGPCTRFSRAKSK